MSLPTSKESALLYLLTDFLETKSLPYHDPLLGGNITWDYYNDIHSPEYNPQGAFWFDRISQKMSADLERIEVTYDLELRLLVSDINESNLRYKLLDWRHLLITDFMKDIRINGISGTYNNITINKYLLGVNLLESRVAPYVNQDNGGTGIILLKYRWSSPEFSSD
jgi:hypothetical protein